MTEIWEWIEFIKMRKKNSAIWIANCKKLSLYSLSNFQFSVIKKTLPSNLSFLKSKIYIYCDCYNVKVTYFLICSFYDNTAYLGLKNNIDCLLTKSEALFHQLWIQTESVWMQVISRRIKKVCSPSILVCNSMDKELYLCFFVGRI